MQHVSIQIYFQPSKHATRHAFLTLAYPFNGPYPPIFRFWNVSSSSSHRWERIAYGGMVTSKNSSSWKVTVLRSRMLDSLALNILIYQYLWPSRFNSKVRHRCYSLLGSYTPFLCVGWLIIEQLMASMEALCSLKPSLQLHLQLLFLEIVELRYSGSTIKYKAFLKTFTDIFNCYYSKCLLNCSCILIYVSIKYSWPVYERLVFRATTWTVFGMFL